MKLIYLFLLIVVILIVGYFKLSNTNMIYVKSDIDDSYYLVRNMSDKISASNTLARIRQNIIKISDYLYENKEHDDNKKYAKYINILNKKVRDIVIGESTPDSAYTSYSVNKGEQIIFCIRTRKIPYNLHDINLMMYVALHEISHVACPIYDNHGPLFKEIFAFIVKTAIKINLYKKIDFEANNQNYCGLMITDSIV
jgi:hypothetical protein